MIYAWIVAADMDELGIRSFVDDVTITAHSIEMARDGKGDPSATLAGFGTAVEALIEVTEPQARQLLDGAQATRVC
ncbi:hypothetical protein RB623_21445 [Mesorhizobium sp. LHD-90]|uniref:hypothetical protein n=1 Tax=Mesorhizobium sp. LHD-90 TaxID=3071414 RepID=UPI0027E10228|nr:hypothetical protein [Mesorhizobium sp. LHD-90]MDQ6436622.1 hypothetical protein [Mesorhizobium sp. LHD-90]